VSFQRYPEQIFSPETGPPTSWGALPVARATTGESLVPLAEGEALWIGLRSLLRKGGLTIWAAITSSSADIGPSTMVRLDIDVARADLAVVWRVRPPAFQVLPIVRASRVHHPCCRWIEFGARFAATSNRLFRFHLCSYQHFTTATGLPAPRALAQQTPYRGWRLP